MLLLLCWLFPLLQAYADGPEARQVDPAVGAAAGAIGAATGLPISALTHGKLPAAAAACECSTEQLDTAQPSNSSKNLAAAATGDWQSGARLPYCLCSALSPYLTQQSVSGYSSSCATSLAVTRIGILYNLPQLSVHHLLCRLLRKVTLVQHDSTHLASHPCSSQQPEFKDKASV
jgi:hypothetical protein